MAAAYAAGIFTCPCDDLRRKQDQLPELEEQRPFWKERRGCDKPAPNRVAQWRGEDLFRCPRMLIHATTWRYVRYWQQWKHHGALPYPGGWAQQPHRVTAAILCVEDVVQSRQAVLRSREDAGLRDPKDGGVVIGSVNSPKPSTGPLAPRRNRG